MVETWTQPGQFGSQLLDAAHDVHHAVAIQRDRDDHDDAHLSLQVTCDQLAGVLWGDAGYLREGPWDKALMTFDSH